MSNQAPERFHVYALKGRWFAGVETKHLRASGDNRIEALQDLQKKIKLTIDELERHMVDEE